MKCADTGLVHVPSYEDYGASFESECCSCPVGVRLECLDLTGIDLLG